MFNSKNPLISPIVEDRPSSPIVNTRGIYPKSDGWYDVDSSGNSDKLVNLKELEKYVDDNTIVAGATSTVILDCGTATI